MPEIQFDTIAAISTPPGEGGIGIIKISGEKAFNLVAKIFHPSVRKDFDSTERSFTMRLGYIKGDGGIVDEVLVSFMRAPNTYTREDIVEINCHGGAVAANEVLRLVLTHGARPAQPGEFTKRAFINGRIDLAQAEAVLDIVKSKTGKALEKALSQLKGDLSERLNNLSGILKDLLVTLEANIDFPDEEDVAPLLVQEIKKTIMEVKKELGDLILSYDTGKIFKDGVLTALSGKPNVGKSSILNSFLKFERAIVTPIPGTTRDVIEEQLNLNGIPFILADTAGITESENLIEKEGVKRSRAYMDRSALVLLVFDGSIPFDKRDIELAKKALSQKYIPVVNKTDLPKKLHTEELVKQTGINPEFVYISAKNGTGLKELEKRMTEMVITGDTGGSYDILVTNSRHFSALQKASAELDCALDTLNNNKEPELIAYDIRSAMDMLGEIIGEVTNNEILDKIFNSFCVGK
jgi:tRNA modification GTPase